VESWSLTLKDRLGVVRRMESGETEVILGSGSDADVLRVEGEGVVARHARVQVTRHGLRIEDLAGGILLNGAPVSGEARADYPASVQIGDSTLVVERLKDTEVTVAFHAPETVAFLAPDPGAPTWSADSAIATDAPLTGKYTLQRELARGGMGRIYFGDDPQLKRQVAVKVSDLAQNGRDLRFVQEAEVLAHLAHPNIVPIYSIGTDAAGRPFYAMKLVQGRTLQAVLTALKNGDKQTAAEYPRPALLTIFRKICDAVAFAHSKHILHRDLKPENIMVGEYGEVLVMDWGLAKPLGRDGTLLESRGSVSGDPGMTMEGEVMGTPQYMSPEQAAGMVAGLDPLSDIYSLGGILYAILTLHPPIEGTTLEEVLSRVRTGELRPMRSGHSSAKTLAGSRTPPKDHVPEPLKAVTLKAMAKDRTDRYPTVEALAADIAAYQNGFATSALQIGLSGQLLLLIRRNRGITTSIAAALLILFALSAWFVLSLQSKERAATRAAEIAEREKSRALDAENTARSEKDRAIESGRSAEAASARARVALAEASFRAGDFTAMAEALAACPEEFRDQTWNYLASKKDSSLAPLSLPGFEKPVAIRAVPGEPGQFALGTENGSIGFADASSRSLLRTVQTGKGLRDLLFSGDGQTFAAVLGPRDVSFHDTATGVLRNRITLPADIVDLQSSYPSAETIALDRTGKRLAAVVRFADKPRSLTLLLAGSTDGAIQWKTELPFLHGIQFDSEDKRLLGITGGSARYFWTFDADTGNRLTESRIYGLCQALHPEGKILAVGTRSGEAEFFDLAAGTRLWKAKLHSGQLTAMAWSSDGHLLTMGTEGKQDDSRWLLKLWAPNTLALRAVFSGLHSNTRTRWAYDPLSGLLLTRENPPRIWRIPAGRERARMVHTSETGYSGAFLSNNVLLARDGGWGLAFYDVGTPGEWTRLKSAPVWKDRYSAVHAQTGRIAITGVDAPLTLHLFSTGDTEARELFAHPLPSSISDLRFHPEGDAVVAALNNGTLQTFSVPTGQLLLNLQGKFRKALFAGPEHQLVVSQQGAGPAEHQILRIHGKTGAILNSTTCRFELQAIAVSQDQRLLALGGTDHSIHFLDAQTLAEKPSLRAHEGEIGALAFHPSLPILASASSDGSIKLWNHETRTLLDHFIGLNGMPVTLAFSPDGRLLFAEAQENTNRLYDVSHLSPRSESAK
jgi:serine/threonine protein kinase/WD40 repeat protein